VISFSTACGRNAHAENRRAVTQPQKDRAGIGAELHGLFDAEQHARPIRSCFTRSESR
jgi:hypothetical protein